jgi:hypothetical protein
VEASALGKFVVPLQAAFAVAELAVVTMSVPVGRLPFTELNRDSSPNVRFGRYK